MKNASMLFVFVVLFSVSSVFCAYGEETQSKEYYGAQVDNPVAPNSMATPEGQTLIPVGKVEPAPGVVPTVGTRGVASPLILPPPLPVEKTTLDNLQTAFNGESNAHTKYLAFAQKADEEGYGKVANLFRAAARAEQVHFEWHAKLIKELGATPNAVIETPVVKSTAENLQASIDGELYESTKMYPEFLAKAKMDKNEGAIDAFEDAAAAEAVHAKLYQEALANLQAWKGKGNGFYVCSLCGNVVEQLNFKNCPICGMNKETFISVK